MKKQRLEQKQYQNLSAQQIQFLGLLQLPVISLEKRIEEELEENVALEEEELEDVSSSFQVYSTKLNYDDYQITDQSNSLEDYLKKQLIDLNLNNETLFLVKYLINSLDDNGFLTQDLYSITSDILTNDNRDVSEKELQAALKILQQLEPVGVGSKNLQECLLFQLKKLYPSEKTALQIISDFYTPFSNKNFEHLIKHLSISQKELKSIYSLIETLKPVPSLGFHKSSSPSKYIYADFTITSANNNLQLQLNRGNTKKLKVSKYYSDLLSETIDEKTKDFLTQKIERAKWFKESMQKRNETLKLVMETIMLIQKDFLISGSENDLKPMKLADVAEIVKMDISTISRVSNSKYVETRFGTFKIKDLFSDAFRKDNGEVVSTIEIKRQLKEIVALEDKSSPFTDEKLSELLGENEYHIARRTVAKYREQLGIKTAKLRREIQ